jgi:thymidylate kinase
MKITPIEKIILEGPDLSGKTTLYKQMHNLSNYRWNIQDRSSLSMVVYARLYDRPDFYHVESLKQELNNLNNIMVILLPSWSVIADRFQKRGDEIQNLSSLKKLYDLFAEAVLEFETYPNVIVIKKEVSEEIIIGIIDHLKNDYEYKNFHMISKFFRDSAFVSNDFEKIGLNITHYDDGSFDDINENMLQYEPEKAYYKKIKKNLFKKIKNELKGNNKYNKPETFKSRRFIFSDCDCLSLCHFLVRNEFLYGEFYFRSSETKETLQYDMNFIKSLTRDVYNYLSKFTQIKMCKITLKIGSGHITINS